MLFKVLLLCLAVAGSSGEYESIKPSSGRLNVYYAYTRDNLRSLERFNGTISSIGETSLAGTRNVTTIIIHGHEGTAFTSLNPTVKDALLTAFDTNVIVVDWSQYSLQSYSNAVSAVPGVGTAVAELINNLIEANITTLSDVHLVGFNLGAHVAGYAGRTLNGQVARITGLDPSRDQWGANSQRLSSRDALYVEVIHTDAFGLFPRGIADAIGHVDIYPNGGDGQPGCVLSGACSHNRAWELFAASLTNTHLRANQCSNLSDMRWNTCRGFLIPLGTNDLFKLASGIFRVNTKRNYPF
ncbi:lipase member H-B [Pieris rapae]|uniref:lipase member H-B n=1 Tax=Pieris rapae TaxID=64459 RepID=UPI001E28017A|nr:lipase member H-B [Pieris rapae]